MAPTSKTAAGALPLVVIVGRPNVGKSALFNRITGRRRAIVTDEPGITRDRIYGQAGWQGRPFEVVDTGGIIPDERAGLDSEILAQARVALERAAVIILVVDARAGVLPVDADLARMLRKSGKRIVVAANKVDTPQQILLVHAFQELGLPDVFPVSAEHGLGVDDLLDSITADFPRQEAAAEEPSVRVAIIGRPNVGKSTLLNRLVGEERVIVSPDPGTTRDAVDTLVRRDSQLYRLIDTAGIRRKGKTALLAEKLSVVMARKHLEQADVALLILDATEGVTKLDATIAGYAHESGRSVILVMNKWDAAQKSSRTAEEFTEAVRYRCKFLDYAPLIFISALTGQRVQKLFPLIDRVAQARRRRVSTGELNRFLAETDLDRGTSPSARPVKILYMTQTSISPPTFVLFTNQPRPLHFSYERFLENRIRKVFDFTGTPIRLRQRLRRKTR
jgi:GTP-binding protein